MIQHNFTPEQEALMRETFLSESRREIRNGNRTALWEYVWVQWPGAVFDDFQRDIIESAVIGNLSEIAIKGCTGPGKGFGVATVANIIFDVWDECKIITTSSDISQATSVMFGEIKAVRQRMKWPHYAKVMTEEFKGQRATGRMVKNRQTGLIEPEYEDDPKKYLKIANPKTGEGMSGQHGPFSVLIADECSAVPDDIYRNALQWAKLIVALSNPRVLSGWFFDLFSPAREDPDVTQTVTCETGLRRLITIGGQDCRNVREKRLKRPIAPLGGIDIDGRHFEPGEKIPKDVYEKVKPIIPAQTCYDQYMTTMNSPEDFVKRVLGEGKFPLEDAQTQLFLKSWFPRCHQAFAQSKPPVEAFGLDLAATKDGDSTVLAAGSWHGLYAIHETQKADTSKTIGWVIEEVKDKYSIDLTDGRVPIAVDNGGMGKSVCDLLAERGCNVVVVSGQGSPHTGKDLYFNRRSEIYGELSRRMSPIDTPETPFAFAPNTELEQELCAHHKIPTGRGYKLTPKDRFPGQKIDGYCIKESLGRSPDRSDALAYLYAAARTLEVSGVPTLGRPLLLLTPEEELQAADSVKLPEDETEEERGERLRREFQADFNRLLPAPDGEREEVAVAEVPFPSFL
jgi:hypothetical protein